MCVKKAKILDVNGYRCHIDADVGFSNTNIYIPLLCNRIRNSITLQSNTCRIIRKTAICNKRIAVFLLTKYLFLRLFICRKNSSTFIQSFIVDKLCFFAFLRYPSGCRSPPLFWFFFTKKSKRRVHI